LLPLLKEKHQPLEVQLRLYGLIAEHPGVPLRFEAAVSGFRIRHDRSWLVDKDGKELFRGLLSPQVPTELSAPMVQALQVELESLALARRMKNGDPAALRQALAHEYARLRLHAARLLHQPGVPFPPVLPALRRLLHDPDAAVRRDTAALVGDRGIVDAMVLEPLREALLHDEDALVRLEALRALGRLGQGLPPIPPADLETLAPAAARGVAQGKAEILEALYYCPELAGEEVFAAIEAGNHGLKSKMESDLQRLEMNSLPLVTRGLTLRASPPEWLEALASLVLSFRSFHERATGANSIAFLEAVLTRCGPELRRRAEKLVSSLRMQGEVPLSPAAKTSIQELRTEQAERMALSLIESLERVKDGSAEKLIHERLEDAHALASCSKEVRTKLAASLEAALNGLRGGFGPHPAASMLVYLGAPGAEAIARTAIEPGRLGSEWAMRALAENARRMQMVESVLPILLAGLRDSRQAARFSSLAAIRSVASALRGADSGLAVRFAGDLQELLKGSDIDTRVTATMALAALGPAGARGLALALRDETPEVAKSAASLLMEMDADDRIDASMLLLDDLGVLPAATQLAYLDLVGASPLALRGPHRPRIRAAVHNLTLAPSAFAAARVGRATISTTRTRGRASVMSTWSTPAGSST
jgi:HEAT repeat protein